MPKFSLHDKVCVLLSWAVMVMHGAAEQDYFPQLNNVTWHEARNHCQACFKELVTLTPDNIHTVVQNLTSESWIGLRKNFSTSSMSWTRWANGDPLTFQNWYPGWPVLKSSFPACLATTPYMSSTTTPYMSSTTTPYMNSTTTPYMSSTTTPYMNSTTTPYMSSTTTPYMNSTTTPYMNSTTTPYMSSTTTPYMNSTTTPYMSSTTTPYMNSTTTPYMSSTTTPYMNSTTTPYMSSTTTPYMNSTTTPYMNSTAANTTAAPVTITPPSLQAECVRSSMLLPTTDDKYIEDSCVAVLRFGAWVERNCLDLLPFVCYEDRFTGQVNKSNVTSSSASLAWQPGPGNISHYRLEVNGDKNVTCDNLTYHLDLDSLTPGTRYEVKVFAVKCERDLNPQVVSFYTKPGQVKNLKDTMVTDTSITLSWNKPDGNVDFYLIEFNNRLINSSTTNTTVVDLTPGNLYTFTVTSRVADNSLWSEESRTNVYTRPGKVSNLMVSDNTNMSLVLSWAPPVGNTSGFWVKAMNDNNHDLFQRKMSKTELNVTVTNLPEGTRITLSVTALANDFLEGDNETIVSYTAPGPISNLSLSTTSSSLSATWVPHAGSHSNFTIELQLDGKTTRTTLTTTPNVTFGDLKTAANYTVIVCSVSGQFKSPPVQSSIFTLPTPPSNAVANSSNKNSIVFNWKAPANIATAKYNVTLSSTFWGQRWSDTVANQLSYTFNGLTSGTKYYFEVRTVAGQQESDPATVTHYTVAEKTEISLSALCSSAEPLLCATDATKDAVLQQLKARFTELLGDNVVWDLKKQESENKAKAI